MEALEIPLEQILVEDRFRKELGDIDELVASIKEKGLIQPISVVARGATDSGPPGLAYRLLAGGRRLEACRRLNLATIPAVVRRTTDRLDWREVELFENIHRKDLTWQERAKLEEAIYTLRKSGVRDVAEELGISKSLVSMNIALAKVLDKIPEVAQAKTASDAWKVLKAFEQKIIERAIMRKVEAQIAEANPEELSEDLLLFRDASRSYRLGDAIEGMDNLWADGVETYSFDFAEVDPPYAIEFDELKARRQEPGATEYTTDYTEIEVAKYPDFLDDVAHRVYSLLKDDTFCVWWFGVQRYEMVVNALRRIGFAVNQVPCIWFKENKPGQTLRPESNFGSSYETFFVARKGNPILRKPGRSNVFAFKPLEPSQKIHNTEKPPELMDELLNCFIHPGSRVLIPFMGSGATLSACYRMNAWGVGWDVEEAARNRFLTRIKSIAPTGESKGV